MARVRICSACKYPNAADEILCNREVNVDGEICGVSLINADVSDALEVGEPPTALMSRSESEVIDVDAIMACTAATLPMNSMHAARETRDATLIFEWGEVALPGKLAVGRDTTFSPLADQLKTYSTVSGRHAELTFLEDQVLVHNVGSTNPTYVDGQAVASGGTAIARSGSIIEFSRGLTAKLKIAE
jgi:FHA domain